MQVDLLYIPDCPNAALARENVLLALDEAGVAADFRDVEVRSLEDAQRLGMNGSPTILVDGRDAFADGASPSLSCRLYDASRGALTLAALVRVLSS